MNKYRKPAFIFVVLIQLFILSFMIYGREQLLRTGKIIRLACQPVDPRSLFSGDYVILNYKISRLDLDKIINLDLQNNVPAENAFSANETVFVGLEKDSSDDVWNAIAISQDSENIKSKYPTVIKGTIKYKYNQKITIKYGIESYFVPQFEGLEIEKNLADVEVEVAVAKSGESAIKTLFIEDKEVEFQ